MNAAAFLTRHLAVDIVNVAVADINMAEDAFFLLD